MLGTRRHSSPPAPARLSVGSRVSTHHPLISRLPEHQWPQQSGVGIVDYSDLIENTAHTYGRSWAITRRYAIALDNGCLISRDTSTLDPEH